jgi:hypothetical protein
MGSGETSPTMVTVHRALAARLPPRPSRAVLIETPYAFQENAADVSARARAYFARSVGLDVTVIPGQAPAGGTGGDARPAGDGLADLRAAGWVFSGPGSPSYALERWRADGTGQALRDRVAAGQGITVMASAAAATIGCAALPVYEVYKAGAAPHWLDGLDLLAPLGLRAAVIPHYDNAEGGTHDTRYCYLGERRLSLLEGSLPAGAAVLGVDEHTAAIFDLDAGSVEVTGRGAVTVRRAGHSTVLPHGTALPLAELRSLLRDGHPLTSGHGPAARVPAAGDGTLTGRERPRTPEPVAGDPPATLTEITRTAQQRFEAAAEAGDGPAMAAVILDLETAISDWAADTEEDQGTGQSRAVLRALVTRLGNYARQPAGNPGGGLAAAAGPLLALRAELRGQGLYPAADAIRDALSAAGLQIQDTPEGTRWTASGR